MSRKHFILKQFEKNKISNYEFYENYDADELTNDIIKKYYDNSANLQYTRYALWYPEIHHPRNLNIFEISLTIKHFYILEKIANGKEDFCLVLEDDVLLCDDFPNIVDKYMKETPKDWDFIFIGSGCNLKPKNILPSKLCYLKEHPASKCADSYFVTKKAAKQIIQTYMPFSSVSDWELAYQMYIHKHMVYWWEPSLVKQGSEVGIFKSTLR